MKRFLEQLFILFVAVFLLQVKLMAQGAPTVTTVQGKVLDQNRKPVQGVTVAELDPDQRIIRAVSTDVGGNYALKISNIADTLAFSYIGNETIKQPIGTRRTINITMRTSSAGLGEVIVVGQRRSDNGLMSLNEKDITTAQAHISAKDLEEMQAASIDQALQGRLPGVDITATSGDPGAGMQIKIRGTSSITGETAPLIVVDGMPYETSIPSDFNFGTSDEVGYASLLNIAPSDIRDITILKDAAATAVYGSRAANGVVVITTKRGSVGRPVLTYTFKGSVTKQPEALPMLNGNQYSTLIPEEYQNSTGNPIPITNNYGREFLYDPNDPYWYRNYSNNTDWIGAISQLGYVQDHNISMTGGGEKARYFASLGYFNQKGTTIGTNLDRINTRINLDYIVSDKIKFRSDLSYSFTNNDRSFATNLRDVAYRKMPNMSIYEYDEYGNFTGNYFSPASNIQGQYNGINGRSEVQGTVNPVAMAKDAKYNIVSQRVTPHFRLDYSILKNILNASFDVQYDINNTRNKSFLPQTATGRPSTEPSVNRAEDGDLDVFNVTTKTNLVYTPKFENRNHSLVTFLSFDTYDNKSASHQERTSNTATSILQDPSTASRTQNPESQLTSGSAETRKLGLLLSSQYGFMDKYLINVGLRADGNSRFGPAHRYGLFPSVSTRWRISGEKFMQKIKSVDDLSLRLSYGQSGNQPKTDYSYFSTYNALTSGGVPFSYLGLGGIYPGNPELRNLTWETVIGKNLGVDLVMFQSRSTLHLDFYENTTKDLFFNNLQISSFTGFNNINLNVGTMKNQGFELGLNVTPIKTKNVQLDLNFNVSSNINVITDISPLYPSTKGDIATNGQYQTFLKINNPFGAFYGFRYKGVYKDVAATVATDANGKPVIGPNGQTIYMKFNYPTIGYTFQPGDAIYEDINHDGNINYQDVVYLGNSNPKFTGGFGSSLTWQGRWKLTAFFNYRYKYDLINGTKMNTTNMYGFDNQSTAVLRRWRKDGDVTDIPRALYRSGYNWLGSDRYVEDASFLRFRTLTLRYTAGAIARKLKLKAMSFYVTTENLFTWTNYTGQDPEVSPTGSDPFRVATDNSFTPPVRTYTVGVSASF
jgi:TonB-linked SusC/RagA family outer membrane protein